jgi:class 3 adenylate cyclase
MEGQSEVVSGEPDSASPILMSPSVERLGEPGRPREAERRQLTVMFVDLVGSTALATRLDPEELRDLLRQFQNTTAGEVLRFEGHVAKLMGDGVLAYFGWPQAHEDEAERAVRAALAVVAAVADLSLGDGQQLSVRVGMRLAS